jgi:PilZ domain
MSEQSNKPVVLPNSANRESTTAEISERRRSARYSFIATAELHELQSQTRVAGRCSDLSLGGCYVDTLAPFTIGSLVQISIRHNSREFRANAAVAYAHPSMGMGIMFTEIKDDSMELLRFWVADLMGEPIAEPGVTCEPSPRILTVDSDSNIRLALNELIVLLVRKKVITETEGAALLIQAFR